MSSLLWRLCLSSYEQTDSCGIRLFSTWCGLCSIDSNSLSSARSTKAAMVGTSAEHKSLCYPDVGQTLIVTVPHLRYLFVVGLTCGAKSVWNSRRWRGRLETLCVNSRQLEKCSICWTNLCFTDPSSIFHWHDRSTWAIYLLCCLIAVLIIILVLVVVVVVAAAVVIRITDFHCGLVVQRFNSVLLVDGFIDDDRPE